VRLALLPTSTPFDHPSRHCRHGAILHLAKPLNMGRLFATNAALLAAICLLLPARQELVLQA